MDFSTKLCQEYLREMCIPVATGMLHVKYIALAIDPSWVLAIDRFLVSGAASSAMMMTSHTTPRRDQ